MPRERKSAKNKAPVDHDGSEPPIKAPKKRRGSAANSGAGLRGAGAAGGPVSNSINGDSMMIPPPQPLGSGYGDTLYASNPFDDTSPMCPPMNQNAHQGMPPQMGPPTMMNSGPGNMMPGNPRMMGPGGNMMGPRGMAGGKPPPPMMGSGPPNMGPNIPSGRTYPPEQSMVFNSANPNAPPIYPCGCCHKEIHDNDQAILCESGCNFWYHRICVGISERAFILLTQEVYAEWVCDNCLSNKNIPLIKFKS
ncbi:Protein pygopus [Sarcoptes scabiei]|uniref:Protein pygopus n=1 Tax=Sarcoptes scabiei TaxID=52283 RepID=A0A132A9E8_SARSC|nr:Protein pygopus [Sarcoptes scabiei]KPM07225.1 protein pygopus-like protein [Sarcoptes scabiei]UXI16599.1 vacuolar protein-sorting-associated protein 25 [Sarcoptes scabiei]